MKYTHESEELNALLGRKVKVTRFDNTTITGVLTRAEWKPDRYQVANYSFRKTHVKKIEVLWWNENKKENKWYCNKNKWYR